MILLNGKTVSQKMNSKTASNHTKHWPCATFSTNWNRWKHVKKFKTLEMREKWQFLAIVRFLLTAGLSWKEAHESYRRTSTIVSFLHLIMRITVEWAHAYTNGEISLQTLLILSRTSSMLLLKLPPQTSYVDIFKFWK